MKTPNPTENEEVKDWIKWALKHKPADVWIIKLYDEKIAIKHTKNSFPSDKEYKDYAKKRLETIKLQIELLEKTNNEQM